MASRDRHGHPFVRGFRTGVTFSYRVVRGGVKAVTGVRRATGRSRRAPEQ